MEHKKGRTCEDSTFLSFCGGILGVSHTETLYLLTITAYKSGIKSTVLRLFSSTILAYICVVCTFVCPRR